MHRSKRQRHAKAAFAPIDRRQFVGSLGGLAALMSPAGWMVGCSSEDSSSGSQGPGLDGSAATGDAGGASGADAGAGAGGADAAGTRTLRSNLANIGQLGDPDENGVRLAEGFSSRIVARAGEVVSGSDYPWHGAPDGGATFETEDGGWIYVSNSEHPTEGGVGALRFDADGNIVDAYRILDGTNINCAGGPTPWGTWLSCEEHDRGRVFECDPWGGGAGIERPALGLFKHEAVAVDPVSQHLYLTEDASNGRFYRFVPDAMTTEGFADLSAGRLEVAQLMDDGQVAWLPVPDPLATGVLTRDQVAESTAFDGGEGIWYHDRKIFFSTKGDNRVWVYDLAEERLTILYDDDTASRPILTGVDNVTAGCCGDVLVAEDGGDMQIVAILPDGSLKPLVQVVGHEGSEITGPAFDPSGTRLYFSSQRFPSNIFFDSGVTFEVTGPFHVV